MKLPELENNKNGELDYEERPSFTNMIQSSDGEFVEAKAGASFPIQI